MYNSLDDNLETLGRTMMHLTANGVDLTDAVLSTSPVLTFDPTKELFLNSPKANSMLTRNYRDGFVCPTLNQV